jgi:DNA-binding beta-propeller fold protein YncE
MRSPCLPFSGFGSRVSEARRTSCRLAGGCRNIVTASLAACFLGLCLYASASSPVSVPAWPPPPAEPYVVYVRSLTRPLDIGVKASALTRFGRWISGATRDNGEFAKPFGLALDDTGRVLVTDTGANAVCCLDVAHKKWLRWTQVGKVRFVSPVAVARRGNTIYVADSGLGKVLAFDEKGKLQFEVTQHLERPSGLAIQEDKLFVADSQLHHVVMCDLKGTFLSAFGQRGSGPGEFNFPSHVAADARGCVYVTDSLNCRVQVFDPSGKFLRQLGSSGDSPGRFSRPKGVAADRLGHVYVVDALFDNVQVFDEQGRLLLNWGEAGSAPGQFWLPNGIAISADDQIYIADSYNRRIQVFKYTGKQ